MIFLILLIFIGIGLYGCATIVTGTTQLITISCNVDGAIVKLDGVVVGKTPFTGYIDKNGQILSIEKEGYKKCSLALSTTLEGFFWGNIITGGTIGSITDFASGAAFRYSPSNFHAELYRKNTTYNDFKNRFELRRFSMVNMSNIAIDLSNNSVPYLESLLYLSNLAKDDNSIRIIREKFKQSGGDQVLFGNLIIEVFENKL